MLFLVLFLSLLPGDWFAGAGINWGTGFTETEVRRATELGVQSYPFSYQKLGFFYDFRFSSPDFLVDQPFSVEKNEREHAVGSSFRFSTGRIQPWAGGGVLFYSERTIIRVFDELIAEEKQKRTIPFVKVGTKFLIWKKLYGEPAFQLDGTARPPWHFSFRTSWRF